MSDEPLVFAVNDAGAIGYAPPQRPPSAPSVPRPLANKAREKQDALRRPQAAHVFRLLKERHAEGASWRELWALGESNQELGDWAVGPIIIWLRAHSVDVLALYDAALGETRFYLVEAPVP